MKRDISKQESVLGCEKNLRGDENLIVFPVGGELTIFYNGIKTRIEKGSVLLLNKALHNIEYNDCRLIVFTVREEDLESIIANLSTNYNTNISNDHICDHCRFRSFFVAKPSAVLAEFFASVARLLQLENFNEQNRRLKLTELIYLILSGSDNCLKSRLLRWAVYCNNRFSQAVFDNLFNHIPITEMARRSCLSITTFKREFSRRFHTSPRKWSADQRFSRARTLLLTSNRTISEIATLCGYTNLSHFSKTFKQRYNATPTAYRKANKADW